MLTIARGRRSTRSSRTPAATTRTRPAAIVAGPGRQRPARAVRPDAERGAVADVLRVRLGDLLRLYRDMDDRDEEPVVVYHSHTATEAYPSRTDIAYASEPGAHYVLVSTREPDADEFRSYRIVDGEVTEEEVRVVAGVGARGQHRLSSRHRRPSRSPDRGETTAWPSRSGSRPSCAPTPTARRPSTARAPRWTSCSTTSTSRHPGLRDRLVDDGQLRRFVNVYVNDEDVRFLGGLETALADGDDGDDPARRRRRLTRPRDALRLAARLGRAHAAGRAAAAVAVRRRAAVGQARGPQPDRLDQGPRRRWR